MPHVGRPSVLLPESLETGRLHQRHFVHLRRRIQPVSPECLHPMVFGPERLRALRLRQRCRPTRAVRFSHHMFTGRIIQVRPADVGLSATIAAGVLAAIGCFESFDKSLDGTRYRPSSLSAGASSGRRPSGQRNFRLASAIGCSLMLARRRCIKPSSSNSQFSLP